MNHLFYYSNIYNINFDYVIFFNPLYTFILYELDNL